MQQRICWVFAKKKKKRLYILYLFTCNKCYPMQSYECNLKKKKNLKNVPYPFSVFI